MPQHQETKQTQCQKQNLQQRQQDSSPTQQEQNQPVPLQQQQQMQHNCEQEQVNTKNQPQLHPPSQPQQQQNYSQVVQQQQRNQQQVRVNQVQSNLPKKSKKQVKREQRLRVLQEQQLAKNAERDEQHPTQQHPRHPRQEQMQQPTNQVSQPQPQVIALKEQQQSKKLQEQETLKPGRQEQLGHPKLEKKNQPTLQQAQHNQPNADQDQKDNKSKQNPPKQTHEREKAPKKKTVNVELAATYRSKQNSNSKAQNSFPRNVVRTQGKPVPLMGISFPRQKSNLPQEPSAAFVQTATQSGMQNQKKPFLTTSSKPGTPTPQSEQDPRAAVISSQITFQCPQEFRNEASQKMFDHKETSTVPRKQRSRTVSSVGPKEKSCQCGHQKQDKMRSPDREKLEQDESQKKLLLEQSSQQQQHQRELKHTHPNQEQRQQKIKQNPPKKQKERERQQQYQQHQQQGQKQQEEFASESAAPVVAKGRAKLKAVHEFQPHPPAFAASAAAFQAQLALTQPPQAPHTARKHKPVAGDATMEMFKSLQVQDSSVAAQANSDAHPKSKTDDSRAATQQSVAPWAVVYNKVSDEDLLSEPSAVDTGKKERREGHGFFSRIFGKKSKALKAKKVPSLEIEQLSDCMQGLKIDSSSPIQDVDVHGESDTDHSCSDTEVPPSSPADDEGSDLAEKSDESSDLEPPSCMEAWEIADDVVEKALCLLPIQVGTVHSRRFTAPDCPFEPELVQRLVSDALEAKRGLKRIKESQALLETFRDCLLKFFEGKDVGDVLPPCNHAPGSHQCSMQPVIQPLLGIIRHVLQETKAIGGPKMEAGQRLNKDGKSQAEPGELRPRRYIKIKRKLTATQAFRAPTKLSVRFCNACADTKQPDGQPLLSCGRCPDVFYCSRECQNVDWITHKFTCPGGDRRSYCKHHGT
ncbi:putative uncharacterized protein DDB_G0271606 [Acanthaster planci]|uniref:MYND-type domain-containing protein n=1 Tax=Acanthaster planci TaxID=133434 RepID=A0A8B7YM55_ACAPL|nr:putative uncharacterized protein DDB_G0271606 [Acanthaster planci]